MDSPDQPVDVAALQKEVDELRQRNESLEHQGTSGQTTWGHRGRTAVVALLLVLGTLCMTLSPLAIWGRNLVLNTDRYVQTLSPVASDPGVQQLVVKAVDKQVDANVDISTLVQQSLPPRATVLAAPLESAFQGLVNTAATRFVQGPAFQKLWDAVNRTAHTQLVFLLTGRSSGIGAVNINDQGEVILDLAPVVAAVKAQLVSAGLTVASHIPTVGATIAIAKVSGIAKARKSVRLLNSVANILPWLGLALFAGAIAVSTRRRRTVVKAALSTAGGMLFIGLILLVARHIYLNHINPTLIPHNTAQFLFDTVVRFLREGIRIVLAVALLVAFIAWFTGPSERMTDLRQRGATSARGVISTAGRGSVGGFVVAHVTALRVAVVALALIALITFISPTVVSLIVLAVIVVALLLLIEAIRVSATKFAQDQDPAASSATA